MFGLALMLGYLGFDGFTSTFQDKLFKVGAAGCVCGGACWLAVLFCCVAVLRGRSRSSSRTSCSRRVAAVLAACSLCSGYQTMMF